MQGLHCCKRGTGRVLEPFSFFYVNGAGNWEVLSTDLEEPRIERLLHLIKRGFSQLLPNSVQSIPGLLTDGCLVLEYGTEHTYGNVVRCGNIRLLFTVLDVTNYAQLVQKR